MADVNTLIDALCAFMTRDSFSSAGGQNLALLAVNNAKMFMMRKNNWQMQHFMVNLPNVDLLNGQTLDPNCAWQSTVNPAGAAANTLLSANGFKVGTVTRAWIPLNGLQQPYFPIDVISRSVHVKRLQRRLEHYYQAMDKTVLQWGYGSKFYYCVRMGNLVYIEPATLQNLGQTFTLGFDAFVWFPPYDTSVWTTDFFLDYTYDFLMYKALEELNFYLKEDQRVPISQQRMEKLWLDAVAWDNGLSANSSDSAADLD